MNFRFPAALLTLVFATTLHAQTTHSATLHEAISLPGAITNGVAIAPGGRTFLVIQKQKGQDVPQVAEYLHGELKPYPDAAWNSFHPKDDPTQKFVHANSIRFDPAGTLWVVDVGSPGQNEAVLKLGPKLVAIDITTGKVTRTLSLDGLVKPTSFVDDVRFNGDHAYLTDAGAPGLIVLRMHDGSGYRALEDDKSVTALKPISADGNEARNPQGKPVFMNADQLELSPDGKRLYVQPISGPMSCIDTQYLDDDALKDTDRRQHVRTFAITATAGGTAIDALGNVYVSQTDTNTILRITPGGKVTTLLHDPRLLWVDAMWITADGKLWLPAAQLNRTPDFNSGQMAVQFPMKVYTLDIGIGPPTNDHR